MTDEDFDILQTSYTVVEAKGALVQLLTEDTANRVIELCDIPETHLELSFTGYPFLYYLLDLFNKKNLLPNQSVLEVGPYRLGADFLCFLEGKGFSVRGIDNGFRDLHVLNMSWAEAGRYIPGNIFGFLYHHRLGPQGSVSSERDLFSSTDILLQEGGFYVDCKRWRSPNPSPISEEFFLEAGYQQTELKIRNNLAKTYTVIDEGYDITIMQKPTA